MPRSAADLRQQARDMERDARAIEELDQTIEFLGQHDEAPTIVAHFPGFARDGDQAANMIAKLAVDDWAPRRLEIIKVLMERRRELKARWG